VPYSLCAAHLPSPLPVRSGLSADTQPRRRRQPPLSLLGVESTPPHSSEPGEGLYQLPRDLSAQHARPGPSTEHGAQLRVWRATVPTPRASATCSHYTATHTHTQPHTQDTRRWHSGTQPKICAGPSRCELERCTLSKSLRRSHHHGSRSRGGNCSHKSSRVESSRVSPVESSRVKPSQAQSSQIQSSQVKRNPVKSRPVKSSAVQSSHVRQTNCSLASQMAP